MGRHDIIVENKSEDRLKRTVKQPADKFEVTDRG